MISQLRNQGYFVTGLWALLLLSAIVSAVLGRWPTTFVALSTLTLAMAPVLLANRFDITLPLPFVAAITVFIIASIVLGETFGFYERFWWWDIVLHATSAIGMGLVGFVIVLMMFDGDRFAAPPWAMCLLALTISVAVGVIWEIFEFTMDNTFGLNMQKSGIRDTMLDLIVNVIGASFASWLGYVYLRRKDKTFWTLPIDKFVALNKRFFRKNR